MTLESFVALTPQVFGWAIVTLFGSAFVVLIGAEAIIISLYFVEQLFSHFLNC